ncbi:putative metal-binding motif-containing protein [Thermodesulfobacteriota bacterium]
MENNLDCDDNNQDIYEGADDVCVQDRDGDLIPIDMNCDGNLLDCDDWCGDNDGDGYVTDSVYDSYTIWNLKEVCRIVKERGECNDLNEYINPDATEECDGVDNNCDEEEDEGCCVDNDHKGCDGTTVYWYDSCGVKENVYENCILSGKICEEGSCVTAPDCSAYPSGCVWRLESNTDDIDEDCCAELDGDDWECCDLAPVCTASCTSCSGFSNVCDETGTKTCTAADCTTSTESCTRDTDGVSCGDEMVCVNSNCKDKIELSYTTRVQRFYDVDCFSNRCYYITTITNNGDSDVFIKKLSLYVGNTYLGEQTVGRNVPAGEDKDLPESSAKSDCSTSYTYNIRYYDNSNQEVLRINSFTCNKP